MTGKTNPDGEEALVLAPAPLYIVHAQHWLAALVSSSSDAIIGLTLDRTIISWNRAATRLLGYLAEEAIGQPIILIIPPEYRAEYHAIIGRVDAGEVVANIETVRLHRDGTRIPVAVTVSPIVDADGQQVGFSAILRDRSAQVQAAAEREHLIAELHRSQQFTREILDVVPSVLYVREVQERKNSFVNRSAAAELGYAPDEIVAMGGDFVRTVMYPDDFARLATHEQRFTTLGDGEIVDFEYRMRHHNGEWRWFLSREAIFRRDKAGRPLLINGTAMDITERKQAEAALRESEQRFRAVWEQSSDAMALSDAAGVVLAANPAYYQLYGYGPEEVLGQSFAMIFSSEQRAWAQEQYQVAFAMPVPDGSTPAFESTILRKNGTERIVESRVGFISNDGERTAMLSTVRDITERKQAEAALRQSEARFRQAADAANALVYEVDLHAGTTAIVHGMQHVTGYDPRTTILTSEWWHEQIHPDDLPTHMAQLEEHIRRGGIDVSEYHVQHCDGRWICVQDSRLVLLDVDGQAIQLIGTIIDITKRKEAEAERARLLASEQAARTHAEAATSRIERLQHLTSALAATLTAPQIIEVVLGEVMAALNAHAASVARVTTDGYLELIGVRGFSEPFLTAGQRIPLATRTPITDAATQHTSIILESLAAWHAYYPELAANTQAEGFEAAANIPLLIDERVLGVLSMAFVTNRTFAVDDRAFLVSLAQQCAQALDRADLLAAKEQALQVAKEAIQVRDSFLSVAAHELRNPLTVVLGSAQMLKRRLARMQSLPERDMHALGRITEQAQHLNQLISTMLDIARLEYGQLEIESAPLELVSLIQQTLDDFEPTLITHTLVWQPIPAPVMIDGDATRLIQVFHNLIGNALKYSPQGGIITVRMYEQIGQVCVAISDEGMGIVSEALPRLFQRFYRAEMTAGQRIDGTGVGLFVVKEIITLHGGHVDVHSQEGVGSTFTVSLPLLHEDVSKGEASIVA